MSDLDGIAATHELARVATAARILVLTTFEQDDYIFDDPAHRDSCSNGLDPKN